jgi:hypothetical protein
MAAQSIKLAPRPPPVGQVTAGWEKNRDETEVKVNGQFTTADARTKLKSLYPSMDE